MTSGAKMRRRDPENLVHEETGKLIEKSILLAWSSFNIPDPIYELPDFPAIRPSGALTLIQQGLGLHSADMMGFRLRLENSVSEHYRMVPGHFDEDERRLSWMSKNISLLADDVCTKTASDWLELALDENHSDADRWYLGYSLLAGRILCGSESASSNQSIPLAIAFGGFANDNMREAPHPSGINAINCLFDASEQSEHSSSLDSWISILATHESVSRMLSISNRAADRLIQERKKASIECMSALVQLIPHDIDSASHGINRVVNEGGKSAKLLVAKNLDSIAGRDLRLGLDLYDQLSTTSDDEILYILASYLYSLCHDDPSLFQIRALNLIEIGNDKVTRRLIESGFRGYLDRNPSDDHSLLAMAWNHGGPLTRSRLKGLIFQQKKASKHGFEKTLSRIAEISESQGRILSEYILGRETS